ncbi:hypothetical protein CSC67_03515 [Pusillimonas caeni]|uniref:hypothetical protein n=1 Tax=Pusillimonas caeni TaxID=1348472 RepID=UPI000E59F196|nr:hypothetical protein [Pusillimonas caeni]TFL15804.1 hypothetical protein CSC67_03515 [Pusillimonas caeni]
MQKKTFTIDELESFWTLLAEGITTAGEDRESVFLTKLALLLANELGDYERVAACLLEAGKDQRPCNAIELTQAH